MFLDGDQFVVYFMTLNLNIQGWQIADEKDTISLEAIIVNKMNAVFLDRFGLNCYLNTGREWLNKSMKTHHFFLYFEQNLIVNLFVQLVFPVDDVSVL
jgi:hypothetical protein